jgi:hypothetical protein
MKKCAAPQVGKIGYGKRLVERFFNHLSAKQAI